MSSPISDYDLVHSRISFWEHLSRHSSITEEFTNQEYAIFIGLYALMFGAMAYFLFCFLDIFWNTFQDYETDKKCEYINRVFSIVHAVIVLPLAFIGIFYIWYFLSSSF